MFSVGLMGSGSKRAGSRCSVLCHDAQAGHERLHKVLAMTSMGLEPTRRTVCVTNAVAQGSSPT